MGVQQSSQSASRHHQPKKRSRWLSIIIIVACILTVLSFIVATIFWIGLVHDKLSDTLGALFTALGTIFGFIALIITIPPFLQYLRERRTVPPPISITEPEIEPTAGSVNIDGNNQNSFIQPGWTVGKVFQSQGDIIVTDNNENRDSDH